MDFQILAWLNTGDMFEAFKYGLAAGSASAFSEKLATKEAVLWYYNKGN